MEINKKNSNIGEMNPKIVEYNYVKMRSDWDTIKNNIIKKGLMAKFSQNELLKSKLLSTENKNIIQDSPYDSYWGIGRDKNGQNMLGKLLMEIRSELR